jgi:quercetin dioxygenase-like cupin family protein
MRDSKPDKDAIGTKGGVFRAANLIAYNESSIVSRTLVSKDAGTITLFAFDQGQGLSEHTAPFDAVVHILEGEAEVTISGKRHHVKQEELITMPANEPHAVHAPTRFKMMLIMIKS